MHEEREHSLYLAVTWTIPMCHVRKLLLCDSTTNNLHVYVTKGVAGYIGKIAHNIHIYEYIVANLYHNKNIVLARYEAYFACRCISLIGAYR